MPRQLLIAVVIIAAGLVFIAGVLAGHEAGVRDERWRTKTPISIFDHENFPCAEDEVLGYSDISRTQVVCQEG